MIVGFAVSIVLVSSRFGELLLKEQLLHVETSGASSVYPERFSVSMPTLVLLHAPVNFYTFLLIHTGRICSVADVSNVVSTTVSPLQRFLSSHISRMRERC